MRWTAALAGNRDHPAVAPSSARQRSLQGTFGSPNRTPYAVRFKQSSRLLRQQTTRFAPLPLDPRNRHPIVRRRLVPHPGDDGRGRSLVDRNSFRAGYRPAPHGRRVLGHRVGQSLGHIMITGSKGQRFEHGPAGTRRHRIPASTPAGRASASRRLAYWGRLALAFQLATNGPRCGCRAPTRRAKKASAHASAETVQVGPSAFTRRVRAASPGGSKTQPSGGCRISPVAVRTVRSSGPRRHDLCRVRRRMILLIGHHTRIYKRITKHRKAPAIQSSLGGLEKESATPIARTRSAAQTSFPSPMLHPRHFAYQPPSPPMRRTAVNSRWRKFALLPIIFGVGFVTAGTCTPRPCDRLPRPHPRQGRSSPRRRLAHPEE